MSSTKKTFVKQDKIKVKHIGILCFLTLAFGVTISFLITKNTLSANSAIPTNKIILQSDKTTAEAKPEETPLPSKIPTQTEAARIKIVIGETREVPVPAAAQINSVVVVSPEIASAEIKNGNLLTITGLKIGETILIVSHENQKRLTLIVQVKGKPSVSERRNFIAAQNIENEMAGFSGSYDILYVHGFDGTPSLVRQKVDFRRKLSE
ncbi:MAG TPA: pilus assembly protein N-terminal domain-containing protein, partial [Pyrinomonadaceae bacterium]|nr:pilus assembly protein N-terminal domain-containing protein [Pyrinomonadaceae bacterium]